MRNLEITGRFRDAGLVLIRVPLRGEALSRLLGRINPSPEDLASGCPVAYPSIIAAGLIIPDGILAAKDLQYRIGEEDEG